jgi:hypothetical protein
VPKFGEVALLAILEHVGILPQSLHQARHGVGWINSLGHNRSILSGMRMMRINIGSVRDGNTRYSEPGFRHRKIAPNPNETTAIFKLGN